MDSMNMAEYKTTKLVMVTDVNNYKYYNMVQINENSWRAEWGRITSSPSTQIYSMSVWNRKYREKIRKGYVDQTDLYAVESPVNTSVSTVDYEVFKTNNIKDIVNTLRRYANIKIEQSYDVSYKNVTLKLVDRAQSLIDDIVNHISIGCDISELNKMYMNLIGIIQRKIRRVQDNLFVEIINDEDLKSALEKMENEQSILDSMRGQVMTNDVETDTTTTKTDLLNDIGILIEECSRFDIDQIKSLMDYDVNRFVRAFKVVNSRTSDKFNKKINASSNKKTEMFWHGSRNENWWNIIQTGLVLRPANAVITGKMFGYGLYFADKFKKSFGYTSCRSAYWTNGSDNRGFLALYKVHVGEQMVVTRHMSYCSNLTEQKVRSNGYDSVFAKGGYDLRNNEYIVYNEMQCNIEYIVEVN